MLRVPVQMPVEIRTAFEASDFAVLFDRVSRAREANGYHALVEGDLPTGIQQAERLLHLAQGMLAWPALGIGSIEKGRASPSPVSQYLKAMAAEDEPVRPNPLVSDFINCPR